MEALRLAPGPQSFRIVSIQSTKPYHGQSLAIEFWVDNNCSYGCKWVGGPDYWLGSHQLFPRLQAILWFSACSSCKAEVMGWDGCANPVFIWFKVIFCFLTAFQLWPAIQLAPPVNCLSWKRLAWDGVHSHQLSIGVLHATLVPRQSCRRVGSLAPRLWLMQPRQPNSSPHWWEPHPSHPPIGPAG